MLFVACVLFGNALIAYDCRTPMTNVTVVSLRDVANCPDPQQDYIEIKKYLQIVQKKRIDKIHVRNCLMEIIRIIMHCGMFSHASVSHEMILSYIEPMGAEGCNNIHSQKFYRIFSSHVINQVKLNGTTVASLTLAGSIDPDGECTGGTYIENGVTWTNVVVTASINILLRDFQASVILDSNEVVFPNGMRCPYSEGYCLDATLGEAVWQVVPSQDCDQFQLLYEGQASIVYSKMTNFSKSSRFAVVEQNDKIFALSLIRQKHICFYDIWLTEHPNLFVLEIDGPNHFSKFHRQKDIDLTAYVNTKLLYIEQSYKRDINKLYADTVYRRCLIQREILQNRLLMAPLVPNAISMLIKQSAGYTGKIIGEALYILQCSPVKVVLRKSQKCYHELPVKTTVNESLFMSPVTRILQNFGEEIECSNIVPPLYNIEGEWIGFSPTPRTELHPLILSPDTEPELKFKPIQKLGSAGIYLQEDLIKAHDAMLFGMERSAMSNIIARKLIGKDTDHQGVSFSNMFSEADWKDLSLKAAKNVWGWLVDIGLFTSGFIGLYTVFRFVKFIAEIIMNGFTIYHVTGRCGVALLAAMWDTLTLWVLRRKREELFNNQVPDTLQSIGSPLTAAQNQISIVTTETNTDIRGTNSTTSPDIRTTNEGSYSALQRQVENSWRI